MRKKELIDNIKDEIENLQRLNEEMNYLLVRIKDEPTFIEIRATASILHDFYSALEKIFEKIALSIDNNLPKGEKWHIELLTQMAKPFPNIRSSVISEDLFEKLKKYLDFRHLFRHIYGFELKWSRIKSLCQEMENVLKKFKEEIESFLNILNKEA